MEMDDEDSVMIVIFYIITFYLGETQTIADAQEFKKALEVSLERTAYADLSFIFAAEWGSRREANHSPSLPP